MSGARLVNSFRLDTDPYIVAEHRLCTRVCVCVFVCFVAISHLVSGAKEQPGAKMVTFAQPHNVNWLID